MKQIFLASTLFELACLAAGIDSGEYDSGFEPAAVRSFGGPAGPLPLDVTERILLTTNNSVVLEQTTALEKSPGAAPLLRRFDRTLGINDLIAPLHPSSWAPAESDLPMLERLIRSKWGLGDEDVELILESPQVNPAIALGRIFRDAPIRVHSDGLMSYGPTRNVLPLSLAQRVTSLHYLPIMGDLRPLLLCEAEVQLRPLAPSALVAVVSEMASDAEVAAALDAALADLDGGSTAFAVGQYLSALGLLEADEEESMHCAMLSEAAAEGCTTVLFKPHPAAPLAARAALAEAANAIGVQLVFLDSPVIAETVIGRLKPRLVVGMFSTALATARNIYDIPISAVGTEKLLDRIAPFQNSNRIPLTLVDILSRIGNRPMTAADIEDVRSLIEAIAYCMQPLVVPGLRPAAVKFLEEHRGGPSMKYFKKRRLMKLGLPGGLAPTRNPRTLARRLGGIGYRLGRHRLDSLYRRRSSRR